MIDLLNLGATGIAGIIGAIGGAKGNDSKLNRREEQYNRDAASQLRSAQAQNMQINAGATERKATQAVNNALAGAQGAALNASAGQMAGSGDFAKPTASAIAGSQAATAATAPFAQQLSQIVQNADQTRMQQSQQSNQNAMGTASLSNHVSYENRSGKNGIIGALEGFLGGANTGSNLLSLINSQNQKVDNPNNQRRYYGPGF